MAGEISRKYIHRDWEVVGVFATAAAYLRGARRDVAEEGMIYYDTTLDQIRAYNGSAWFNIGESSSAAWSLDKAAQSGVKITSAAAIEIEASASTSNLFILDANGTTNVDILDVSSAAGTGDLINLTQGGSGKDINGTSGTWSITAAGALVATGLTMDDDQAITLGGSSDAVLQWDQTRLALTAAADSTLRLGAAAFSYDVEFIGITATTNLMKWDLVGGDGSVGALVFDNADIDLGDSDLIRFGDGPDFTLGLTSASPNVLKLLGDNQQLDLGANGAGFDMYWYTENSGDHVYFDEDNAVVDFVDVNMMVDDDSYLYFGSNDDFYLKFISGGSPEVFRLYATTQNTKFEIGTDDHNMDVIISGATSTNYVKYDTDDSALQCNF